MFTKTAVIKEEVFAGPSTEKFVEFNGLFERKLDLATIGTHQTLWIVFLMSAVQERQDIYAPASGSYRVIAGNDHFVWGIRASTSAYPPRGYESHLTYKYPDLRQFAGAGGTLGSEPRCYLNATDGNYYFYRTEWRMLYREDGTQVNYSGGYQVAQPINVGPSIRRPFGLAIRKNVSGFTYVGVSVPQTMPSVDITKQDCKDWLLNNSTSLDFIYYRPTGNTYGPPGSSGIDIAEGTYGELDTIFWMCNKPGVKMRLHGVWGRAFNTDL